MLVLHCGISPKYVLDEMEPYEMKAIIDNIYMRTRDDWERTRYEAYVTAQVNSKNSMKPSDLIKFSWEKGGEKGAGQSDGPTRQQLERLRAMANHYIENKTV